MTGLRDYYEPDCDVIDLSSKNNKNTKDGKKDKKLF